MAPCYFVAVILLGDEFSEIIGSSLVPAVFGLLRLFSYWEKLIFIFEPLLLSNDGVLKAELLFLCLFKNAGAGEMRFLALEIIS